MSAVLHLLDLLELRPDEGLIRFHDQRMLLQGAAAMGLLRKALLETLGLETARRLLLRFGYADGYHDAVSFREHLGWRDPLEGLRAGTSLHTLEGIVHSTPGDLRFDGATGAFTGTLSWRNSYEAEQHLIHHGRSETPVCWTLVGYASGYASACIGRDVYFRETTCAGRGDAGCQLEGRDARSWGPELETLRFDFQGADLRKEVTSLRAAALRKKRELARRERALARLEVEMDIVRGRAARYASSHRFVARSPAMADMLEMAARVAPLDTTVLVCGESGTGKEFIARMIHDESERSNGPLISVNCAALTETLLESELFGHVRGAFTGAVRDKAGLFELAGGGTLFLDEIGEIAAPLQAKLLRALQEREIRRVGGDRAIKVNVRVIAATNRDLRKAVANGTFRDDLYFRLGAFVITVPPLRERPEDIPYLVHEFLRRAAQRLGKDVRGISAEAMANLVAHPWPGNVRELEHAIERAVILARGSTITARELPLDVRTRSATPRALDLRAHQEELIRQALQRFPGNRRAAAEALGISPVTLWRKMRRLGLSV